MKIFNIKNYLICIAITMLMVVLRMIDPFFIETARLKGLDYYQNKQEKVKSENIAIIEIDESSLDEYGQWPWKRDLIANGIIKAFESGAQLVVIPILFAEPDRLGGDKELISVLDQVPVIIGQSASTKGKGTPVPRGLATIGESLDNWLFDYPEAIGPVKGLGESAAGVGMILTAPELDGVVRRMPLVIQIKGESYPTVPLEVIRLFAGQESYQAKVGLGGVEAIRVPGFDPITTDENSRIWLNFKYEFDKVSFKDADWSIVKDKIAVLGLTGEGLANTIATPVGIRYGHEVNSQALQMIIDESRLQRPTESTILEVIITAAFCSLLILGALWLSYMFSLVAILASLAAGPIIGNMLYSNNGWLIDYTWPFACVFVTWACATFIRFINENRSKQLIKKQFEHYLAPPIVKLLQKDPSQLKLGGDTRELSILFSDLRGFTTISEHFKTNPQGLTELVNRYLTPMTGCVIDHEGTVDKFIGDALMAFWNAPVDIKDHKVHSIQCGLKMFDLLAQLNREVMKEGIDELKIGVGINTGDVVVGNMGSEQRFDYTCLGDAVNLSSRLEGQTKEYKVGLIVGQGTVEGIEDKFNFVELDKIAVKGKKEGVRIFAVLEDTSYANHSGDVTHHNTFLQYYRSRQWGRAIKLAELNKLTYPELREYYQMMEARIAHLKEDDPGEDWDTIFRATSK
jgi:adenylate cyclase